MSDTTTLADLGYAASRAFGGGVEDDMGDGGAKKFYGKYRGTVINNVDPKKEGRLWVQVPDVLGLGVAAWAQPCLPFGGIETGLYAIPQNKAGVWVEFEQGNPDKPIWVGTWWGTAAEVPKTSFPAAPGLPVLVIQTPGQNGIVVHDLPFPLMPAGGVMIKSATSQVVIGQEGITLQGPLVRIQAGAVEINGVTDINKGALTVT